MNKKQRKYKRRQKRLKKKVQRDGWYDHNGNPEQPITLAAKWYDRHEEAIKNNSGGDNLDLFRDTHSCPTVVFASDCGLSKGMDTTIVSCDIYLQLYTDNSVGLTLFNCAGTCRINDHSIQALLYAISIGQVVESIQHTLDLSPVFLNETDASVKMLLFVKSALEEYNAERQRQQHTKTVMNEAEEDIDCQGEC